MYTTTPPDNLRTSRSPMNEPSGTSVLMFSHYINHIENTGSLEGHRMLMAHECLMVVATLGYFHRWQRRVELAGRDKPDWMKVPTVSMGDFRYKYSPVLDLLGNAQHLTYAHPKLLGQCFDNVYHQGQLIGDLPARGKLLQRSRCKRSTIRSTRRWWHGSRTLSI